MFKGGVWGEIGEEKREKERRKVKFIRKMSKKGDSKVKKEKGKWGMRKNGKRESRDCQEK